MKTIFRTILAALLGFALVASAFASSSLADNQAAAQRLNKEVHHALAMIPQFTVFDDVSYRIDGGSVTLYGEVRNAVIKDEAQAALKHIEGVEQVVNHIEILPVSFNDDQIRRQVARAVFADPRLSMYAIQPVPPIHIIVKNGHVDLVGLVRTQTDKDSAFIRANGVPGVFSVENRLQVEKS
jgi:hyperosmotically inducible protein